MRSNLDRKKWTRYWSPAGAHHLKVIAVTAACPTSPVQRRSLPPIASARALTDTPMPSTETTSLGHSARLTCAPGRFHRDGDAHAVASASPRRRSQALVMIVPDWISTMPTDVTPSPAWFQRVVANVRLGLRRP